MKKFSKFSPSSIFYLLVTFVFLGFTLVSFTFAATTPSLGAATDYAILSDTYTNPLGPTTLNGSVGFTTAPAVIPLGIHINYGVLAPYAQAGLDQITALNALNVQGCTFTFVAPAVVLDATVEHSSTYEPGVYCNNGTMAIGTPAGIVLSGAGTYIFRSNGALNTVANSTITLTNGASACNVFWTPIGAVTLNANSKFVGTIIPNVAFDITILDSVTWVGRALAFGHTITTSNTNVVISVPNCVVPVVPVIPVSPPSGGGGGSSSLTVDKCGNGDYSESYYDKKCGTAPIESNPSIQEITSPIIDSGNNSLLPLISISQKSNRTTPFPFGGGYVVYNYVVNNLGLVPLSDVSVVDNNCSSVSNPSGDTNKNNLLDTNESWKYICGTYISVSTENTTKVQGKANDDYIYGYATAQVVVLSPGFPHTGFSPQKQINQRIIAFLMSSGILVALFLNRVLNNQKIKCEK